MKKIFKCLECRPSTGGETALLATMKMKATVKGGQKREPEIASMEQQLLPGIAYHWPSRCVRKVTSTWVF